MLIRPLPHPGYTWAFSQHAAGFDEETVKGMLSCALPFEGTANAGQRITELMQKAGLLTANLRDGKADAWRDYQQILSELGLIVSTKLEARLTLTNVAKALIADEISFHQLMSMQVLRYQYPNGQKHDRSPTLRRLLLENGQHVPDSLIELHVNTGVLVKPGLLVLQVLLGLLDSDEEATLSADECRAALVPCKTNAEADEAVDYIKSIRRLSSDLTSVHNEQRLRRNIQDWFKLLKTTGLFDTDGRSYISLSASAIDTVEELRRICDLEAQPIKFWLPTNYDQSGRLTWFEHYGRFSSSFEAVANLEALEDGTPSTGGEASLDDEMPVVQGPVRLMDFDKSKLFDKDLPNLSGSLDELAKNVLDGAMKRHAKSILHDQIVSKYAERFVSQGAEVKMDPNSVDIFVKWNPQEIAIFEVKTVSQRSLTNRIRFAVGQVKEYAYRLKTETGEEPEQVIIIDRPIEPDSWQRDYLNNYMGIGLVCSSEADESIYSQKGSVTSPYWAK